MNGVIVIDKPSGMTSHDVVNRVRRILGEKSVGHLGTLDPMATGVLPLVAGRMTRLAQFYTSSNKSYEGEIRFGMSTTTYDADGETVRESATAGLSVERVRDATGKFVGVIEQVPPPFSAKKIAGVPAYKLARKKKEVELKPVQVEVRRLEIFDLVEDRARFVCDVSSGTYVRSIANDLGERLGCGAHLSSLRRTVSGEFRIEDAVTLETLAAAVEAGAAEKVFVHPRRLLPEFPSVMADEENVAKIRHGRAVNLPELSKAKLVKVFQGQSELIAIASRVAGTLFHPKVVLLEVAQ
jgi:tRNA pseudouridine55 synthase